MGEEFKSGFVTLIGRTNVGKSTLLNLLVGEKVAAIANKVQTTRTAIKGIVNRQNSQIIFVDTPGIHKPKTKLNETMVETSFTSLTDSDIVLFLIEATSEDIGRGDRIILDKIKESKRKTILIINKIDLVKKEDLKFIKKEQKAIENLGFNCEYVTKTGLPFEIEGAICFKNQAQFHPLKYLNGLCHCIAKNNNEIYTNSTVFDVQKENDFYITFSNNFNVKSQYVIVATHYPFINFPGFYFAKMYQSTSYLIAVDTKKTLFNGMYISATNPILSFRTANYNGKELLLIGGGEHKTGQPTSYQNSYGMLEEKAKKYYPKCEKYCRYSRKN